MINLYELQEKYCKMIYVSSKVLKVVEQEGIYWLCLALEEYLKGIEYQRRFAFETYRDIKNCEKIIIKLREENRYEKNN